MPAKSLCGASRLRKSPPPVPHRRAARAIIVDADPDVAETLAVLLGLFGQDTVTADDLRTGLAAAGPFRPDVVFIDPVLPTMNVEAVRLLRCPIVAVSEACDGSDPDPAVGRFGHRLTKPFDPDALARLLGCLGPAARRTEDCPNGAGRAVA